MEGTRKGAKTELAIVHVFKVFCILHFPVFRGHLLLDLCR